MQSSRELTNIISCGLPDISSDEVALWVKYLSQLKGCHLFSVASPEKDKAEWLLERRAGIGGSEVAAIMGENHWNSPRQIWMSKMGVFDEKPATQSEPAHWGNLLENIVAKEWGNRTKHAWVHIPIILQDDERPWLLANIDGFTLSDDSELVTGILEIKTTSAFNRDVWET
ncbi:MAG: YqaJ viral recombinase family protein, partial [Acinetobacter sp.]